jgi:chaperone required for assembly of F1-ATPase
VKRFWSEAAVAPAEGGFAVLLDGRPVRLPGGASLRVAQAPLAEALAAEWQGAGGARGQEFRPEEIPLTRLVGTAQERIAPDPAPMVQGIAQYGESDLLCYRADDRRLAARQTAEWDPWLRWSEATLGAPLLTTEGIMHVAQPAESLAALHAAVAAHAPLELAALGVAVPALGSLVLGLALLRGELDAAEAHRLSILDELFQEELWGSDREALARRRNVAADLAHAARLAALARA